MQKNHSPWKKSTKSTPAHQKKKHYGAFKSTGYDPCSNQIRGLTWYCMVINAVYSEGYLI